MSIHCDPSHAWDNYIRSQEREEGNTEAHETAEELEELFDMDLYDVTKGYSADDPLRKPVQVVLACSKEYWPEDDVEFRNIEEDIQGRDVLTFTCPRCHATHRSYRLG